MKALIHGAVYFLASLTLLASARAAESVPSLFVEGLAGAVTAGQPALVIELQPCSICSAFRD